MYPMERRTLAVSKTGGYITLSIDARNGDDLRTEAVVQLVG